MRNQKNNYSGTSYVVQPGDTLYDIAQKYNIMVKDLISANPRIKNPEKIFVGQKIFIPIKVEEFEKRTVVLTAPEKSDYSECLNESRGVILLQQLSETNYDLSVFAAGLPDPKLLESPLDLDSYALGLRTFGRERGGTYYSVLPKTEFNSQQATWSLALGQINWSNTIILGIFVYDSTGFVPGPAVLRKNDDQIDCLGDSYTIQLGDTLYDIAKKYNITLGNLIAANPQIEDPNQIFAGQFICIPTESVAPSTCAAVLTTPDYLQPVSGRRGGVVLAQKLAGENYGLTFGTRGLPEPESIDDGRFDAYIAGVGIEISTGRGRSYSAVLDQATYFNQLSTWSGTIVIPENPFIVSGTRVSIMPYVRTTGVRTNPLLVGLLEECKS